MGIWDDIKSTFRNGSNLTKLLYINVGVFIFIKIIEVFAILLSSPGLMQAFISFLAIPASLPLLITRPWTIITYMFLHEGFIHLIFNLLWLYWFGRIFLEYLDQKKLVAVYMLGGISGAALYVLSFNIFPAFSGTVSDSIALGASAAVMAIVVAIAAYVPDYTVYLFLVGKVKLKYLALIMFILTSILDFSVNSGGKIAHIGGALFGYLFAIRYRQGKDIGKGINRVIDSMVTMFKPRKKLKVTYKKSATEYDYNTQKVERQAEINLILDKISKGGYDSLTKNEKDLLFKESQKKN
jgi:membrane associated rhomboid family serine protease